MTWKSEIGASATAENQDYGEACVPEHHALVPIIGGKLIAPEVESGDDSRTCHSTGAPAGEFRLVVMHSVLRHVC